MNQFQNINRKGRNTLMMCIFACLFSISFNAIAQVKKEWAQTFRGPSKGMDEAHAIATDANGNVYITGVSANNNGDLDIITIAYSATGTELWKQTFNGTGNDDDNGKAIAIDATGNVYVAGYTFSKGTMEGMVLIKYNTSGSQMWIKTYDGSMDSADQASAIALDAQGNVFITGFSSNKGTGTDITTLKFDPDGNQLWVKTCNGTANENDAARAIVIDDAGNAYVTGYAVNADTNYDITTIKYAPNGDQLWVRTFDGKDNDYDEGNAITIDPKGDIYVAGFTDVSEKRNDLIVIKYSASGDQQWVQTYSGKGNDDEARAITFADGKVFVTGHSTNKGGDFDIITLCYSANGNRQWVQTYAGDLKSDDEGIAIAADAKGSCYITGYLNNVGLSEEIVILKYDSNGQQNWMEVYNGSDKFDDYPYDIKLDKAGNIIVAGATNYDVLNNTNDGDIILLKYSNK